MQSICGQLTTEFITHLANISTFREDFTVHQHWELARCKRGDRILAQFRVRVRRDGPRVHSRFAKLVHQSSDVAEIDREDQGGPTGRCGLEHSCTRRQPTCCMEPRSHNETIRRGRVDVLGQRGGVVIPLGVYSDIIELQLGVYRGSLYSR